jgi:uncharacterized protein (UPF0548 family)
MLGRGIDLFEHAAAGIRTRRAHDVAGLGVFPLSTDPTVGGTVVITLGATLISLAAPCRFVTVIDEPGRSGFVYVTLPGHPETGEEASLVTMNDAEDVHFQFTAVSAPPNPLSRLASPATRSVQSLISASGPSGK